MKIKHRAHYNSLKERVEVALIGTTIALFADMWESVNTMMYRGVEVSGCIIMLTLLIGMGLAISELVQTHTINFKYMLKELKLIRQKRKHNIKMMIM